MRRTVGMTKMLSFSVRYGHFSASILQNFGWRARKKRNENSGQGEPMRSDAQSEASKKPLIRRNSLCFLRPSRYSNSHVLLHNTLWTTLTLYICSSCATLSPYGTVMHLPRCSPNHKARDTHCEINMLQTPKDSSGHWPGQPRWITLHADFLYANRKSR